MKKLKKIIKSCLVFISFFILSILLSSFINKYSNSNNFWVANLSGIVSSMIVCLILYFCYYKEINNDFTDFKKKYSKYLNLAFKYWVIGVILMIVTNKILIFVLNDIAVNEASNRDVLMKWPLYSTLSMCLFGPISEEITFRLNIRKIFNSKWIFIMFSALLFGYAHVMGQNFPGFLYIIPYSTLGIFFAKAYYETNNIFTSFIMHIFHNSLTIALIFLTSLI